MTWLIVCVSFSANGFISFHDTIEARVMALLGVLQCHIWDLGLKTGGASGFLMTVEAWLRAQEMAVGRK